MKIANDDSATRLRALANELAQTAGVDGPRADEDPRQWIETHIADMASHVQMAHRTRMDDVLAGTGET